MKTGRLQLVARIVAAAVVLAAWAFAQSALRPQFEVASVKPSPPSNPGQIMRRLGPPDPGMVNYGNATLKMLISRAYSVMDYQVSGPDWIDSLGYDVVAKVPAGAAADQVPPMLQSLLAERFKLALHRESKSINVYALIVGKDGPKLKETDPAQLGVPPGRGVGGFGDAPPPPPPPGGPGVRMLVRPGGARQLSGHMTMEQLTNTMSFFMDRPVVDLTGLKGTYDVDLAFMPDERDQMQSRMGGPGMTMAPPPGAGDQGTANAVSDAAAGSIFSAVQEKLGLKLDPRKSPAEILVIDHAEKVPTEN
jgi:uncharacterized protein (TIGR03435 family)